MKLVRTRSSAAALGIPGTVTPTSLVLRPNVPFKTWHETVETLKRIEGGGQWWIGDALNYGEAAYGEKYAQAVDESQARTWQAYAWVASRYEITRRLVNVAWSTHQALAGIEDEHERYATLKRAAAEEWTLRQAREYVRDLRRIQAPPLPSGKFSVILADPPWRFEFDVSPTRAIENHYPTMTVEEIAALPVGRLAGDNAVLFLWAPAAQVKEALEVAEAWGFTCRTGAVWVKDRIGMGYYFRQQHELLWLATHGEVHVPAEADRPSSVIQARRGRHSEKPEVVYKVIERMFPGASYLELFARRARPGWVCWGDEVSALSAIPEFPVRTEERVAP